MTVVKESEVVFRATNLQSVAFIFSCFLVFVFAYKICCKTSKTKEKLNVKFLLQSFLQTEVQTLHMFVNVLVFFIVFT